MFSPWYRWSGRRDPQNHVCLNVATCGPGGAFAMTDRGATALTRSADTLTIGPSSLHWDGQSLVANVNELASLPKPKRIAGTVTLTPSAVTSVELPLKSDGTHIWRPFAPVSRIDVDLGPGWQWSGTGYLDGNFGTAALEDDFDTMTWGRFPTATGARVIYEAKRCDGTILAASMAFDADGTARHVTAPPIASLPRSRWAVRRETRADAGYVPRQIKPMLDAPFYTRSVVQTRLDGEEVTGVHESIDLRRFRYPLLKPMLAVRVPRRTRWT